MSARNCVIVGASHAGVSLALALRKQGWDGAIKLVDAENELPYHRPPLSKEFLAGNKDMDAMRLRPASIYEDNAIDLLSGTTASGIDTDAKNVILQNGQVLRYEKLALCTGASPIKLPIGKGLDSVCYIRTSADVELIRQKLHNARHVAVIGGGYIGLEAAATLKQLGIRVTVLEMAERVLSRVTSQVLSGFMTGLHDSNGVHIKTGCQVSSLRQASDSTDQIEIEFGTDESMSADMVLVGVGVSPNTQLAEMAGLATDDGIVVDEYACSSDPHIYAAGDCTRHPNPVYQRTVRLESVQNATDQARAAAANICGKATAYNAVPWFWSDQFDVKLQMAGLSDRHDEVIVRGSPAAGDAGFALFYFAAGRLIASDCVNRPKEFMVSRQLIAQGRAVDRKRLSDETSDPASWLG